MIEVRRTTTASPAEVFAVLADGWLYPSWVVGASRMRAVDSDWPGRGSRLHHSFGVWPGLLDDTTEVVDVDAPNLLLLKARGWPVGEATVRIEITAIPGGCDVMIAEDAARGPGKLVPKPLRQPPIAIRNRETLQRLVLIAEGRAGTRPGLSRR